MKKILLVIVLCFICMNTFSQRLLFKGYEISGNAWTLKENLEKQGFRYVGVDSKVIELNGTYLGYYGSWVRLYKTFKTSKLYGIQVTIPRSEKEGWMSQYEQIKSIITNKYGQPREAESFERLYVGSFSMACRWVLSNGEIILANSDSNNLWCIMFLPFGWQELRNSELQDDL
jgi:hypothetical protein